MLCTLGSPPGGKELWVPISRGKQRLLILTPGPWPSVFVRRFAINDIKLVLIKKIELLGQNKVDRGRAAKTPEIGEAYNMAVAVLRGDV